jgi:dihydrofolate synthase/folylpolyglutamate synthase
VNYREAIEYLYALSPRGIELGLHRVEQALRLRGDPHLACPSVLVAGTNGKGSVATMVATVLAQSGHKVGLFTSPHLHRLVERFRIGGRPVAERTLARHVSELRPLLEQPLAPRLTFFELLTVLAFELFREARCDVAVLEVGLGGRLDATNVVTPMVAVISSVALDHTERLGPTLVDIAREKAGIIKASVPIVSGVRERAPARVIRERARRLAAPLLEIDRDFSLQAQGKRYRGSVGGWSVPPLSLPLAGEYQRDNLACAVAALSVVRERFFVNDAQLRRGLARVRWPGRLELIEGAPAILCDAAHNPHACEALARHLADMGTAYAKRVLLFGVMRDKEHGEMIARLRAHFDAMVFTSVDMARAEPADRLAQLYGGEPVAHCAEALARAQELAGKRGLVVACGSIFVMAAVRARVLRLRADPPIAL